MQYSHCQLVQPFWPTFLLGSVYFAISSKSSAGTILLFELYPALFHIMTLTVRWTWSSGLLWEWSVVQLCHHLLWLY